MIRGTTPTFTLTLQDPNVDLTLASHVYATFQQTSTTRCWGKTVVGNPITKTGDELVIREHEVDVYFDQEDSLNFTEGRMNIQLNWTYENGVRACSNIINIPVGPNLIGEVIE